MNKTKRKDIEAAAIEIEANSAAYADTKATTLRGNTAIVTTGWGSSSGDYNYAKNIYIAEIQATDWVEIVIDRFAHDTASEAELCPTVVTGNGYFTVWCNTIPTANIPFDWRVVR